MDVQEGVERVLLGEPIAALHEAYRQELLADFGLDPKATPKSTFAADARRFANKVCRELGDRHAGDERAMVALRDWVRIADDYEPWDALMANFEFEDKEALLRRGRLLFPGPLTGHWQR